MQDLEQEPSPSTEEFLIMLQGGQLDPFNHLQNHWDKRKIPRVSTLQFFSCLGRVDEERPLSTMSAKTALSDYGGCY